MNWSNKRACFITVHRFELLFHSLVIVIGLTVMYGWITHETAIIQIAPSYGPMQFNTALCFLICGTAALAGQLLNRQFFLLGLLAGLVGLITLLEYGLSANFGIDEFFIKSFLVVNTPHPGRMSPISSAVFLLGGVAIAALRYETGYQTLELLGNSGALISALGAGIFLGYLFGEETPYGLEAATHMGIHTSLAFFLLGAAIVLQAWQCGLVQNITFPRWLIAAAAIFSLGMVLSIWQTVVTNEQRLLRELVLKHVVTLEREINAAIKHQNLALVRFNERWTALNGQPRGLFDTDASNYLYDQEALMYMGVANISGLVEWEVQRIQPSPIPLARILGDISGNAWSTIPADQRTLKIRSQTIGDMPAALVVVISQPDGRFMISIYNWDKLLPLLIEPFLQEHFSLRISDYSDSMPGLVLYNNGIQFQPDVERWRVKKIITVQGLSMQLEISPTIYWVTAQMGMYSYVVLLVGLLLVTLGIWSLGLARKLFQRSRKLTSTTENLKREIDMRRNTQEELQNISCFNQLLLKSAGEGIYVFDAEGITTFVNPTAARILGYEIEELIGKPRHEMIHHSLPDGSPYPITQCPMSTVMQNKQTYHHETEVLWRKDGTPLPVSYTATPLLSDEGICLGAVMLFQDISERKQHEGQLESLLRKNAEQIHQLKKVAGFAAQLNIPRPLPDLLQLVSDHARLIIGSHFSAVFFTPTPDWSGTLTGLSLSEKYSGQTRSAVPSGDANVTRLMFQSQSPVRMTQEECKKHPYWAQLKPEMPDHPFRQGWLAVPLSNTNGQNIGVIQVADKYEGDFSDFDESVLVQMAQMTSPALEFHHMHDASGSPVEC